MKCFNTMRGGWMAAAAAISLAVAMTAPLRGAVIFTDIPDEGHFGGDTYFYFDLNADGITDATLFSRDGQFGILSTATSRIAGISGGPLDANSFSYPFSSGDVIGADLLGSLTWNSGSSALIGSSSIGHIGLWGANIGYVGVEFQIGSDTHYGWIEIEVPFFFAGGYIRSYAYESEPGRPIIAGAIPEPATVLYFITGIALLWTRNKKDG